MGLININYNDTINKAAQLEDLASDMKKICNNDIENAKETSYSTWKGDAGDVYRKKLGEVQLKIKKRADNLSSIANNLGKTAKYLRQVEEYTDSLFKK